MKKKSSLFKVIGTEAGFITLQDAGGIVFDLYYDQDEEFYDCEENRSLGNFDMQERSAIEFLTGFQFSY